jgi:two-component system sensor histidine kinase PrrB
VAGVREDAPARVRVTGIRAQAGELNLVENAARYGATRIRVSVAPATSGLRLIVDDDGPGIPAAERDRVRRRFERGSTARGDGSGLGLALVEQQARLHGGSLELGESELGGLQAKLVLPR